MSEDQQSLVLNNVFTIRLEMLSDWHVGTGTGIPGSIDALLAKDGEGFPFVPAKTIVGIWRDAMETLTYGLDKGIEKGDWSKWVEVIFGIQPNQINQKELEERLLRNENTYSHSILSLRPARMSEGLRETIKEKNDIRLIHALTFVKPEIKIDEDSGTSANDMLRFAEMGRIGTVLRTACNLDFGGIVFDHDAVIAKKQREIISALLIASARLVERLGGKRRRGSGKCKLEIGGKPMSSFIVDYLRDPATPTPSIRKDTANYEFAAPDSESEWRKLEYSLTLKTPVSIVTATLGNVSKTLDFIPGTYVLPHITKGKKLFKHVANGDLQVSPATIVVNGRRGLSVPKVIFHDKLGGGFNKVKDGKRTVYNRFHETDRQQIESGEQKKNYREGYISELGESGKLPFHEKTPKTLLMHNTVEDDFQRPTSDVGGVYSRQAIAATRVIDDQTCPTVLCGEIRFKQSIESELKSLANTTNDVRLGTSKKDDYGLAELKIGNMQAEKSAVAASPEVVVYLESDVLLRNGNLRQTNLYCDLIRELEKALGNNSLDCTKDSLIQTRRIESWNVGWGFPRPTLIAMAAGSCVKFAIRDFDETKKDELSSKLTELQNSGIGERRGEGYGRIRFNPKLLTEQINRWTPEKESSGNSGQSGATSTPVEEDMKDFAKQLEMITWREELQRAVMLIADDPSERLKLFGFEKGGKPSMSQIGGLRSVISRLRKPADGKTVTSWIDHLQETANRLEKWGRDKQQAKSKLERIRGLITQDTKVWLALCETTVNNKNVWESPPTLVRTKEELQRELWAEAVRSLFDACMRSHKGGGGDD